jgi:TldD protein
MVDQAILEKALRIVSPYGDYADIYVEEKSTLQIILEDQKIEKILTGIDAGAGLRILKNFKTIYGHTNDLSEKSIIELANSLKDLSKGSHWKGTRGSELTVGITKQRPTVDFKFLIRPEEVPLRDKLLLLQKAEGVARESSLVKQVKVTYSEVIKNVKVINSRGRFAEDERIYTTFTIHVIASLDGELQVGYEAIGGLQGFELLKGDAPLKSAEIARNRVILMLKARKAPGGRMPVVISSEAGGTMIHEAIGHGLEADLSQNGLSVFGGKTGMPVASPLITVIDDATMPGKRGSFRFDDEGTPAERTILVAEGILKNYMYDILTGMKDGVNSTGNGRRESYRYKPIPRMTNTIIAPGKDDPEDIIRSVEKGLFVKKMGGGQVNTVTGDFVFEVQEGYLIEKGKVSEPVRGATLTGNGPEVLKAIDMVGNDLGFSIGTCGKDSQGVPVSDGMPTVRIPEMVVGGIIQ